MISQRTGTHLTLAALAAMVGVLRGEEIASGNHPALQRAFSESPESDKDANGALSLEEYNELIKHERPHDPENPKAPLLPVRADGDLVVHDFEDNNVMQPPKWSPVRHTPVKDSAPGWHMGGSWSRDGTAFNRDLTSSTRMMKRRVGPYQGKFFVTTIGNSENATGSLRSPVFLIEQDFIVLTMSGGAFPQRICVNLHLGEGIVRSATGTNDDYFERVALDVREFRGQLARLELLDNHRGLWGHLNVDEILMSADAGAARVINRRPEPSVSLDGLAVTANGFQRGPITVAEGALVNPHGSTQAPGLFLALNPRREAAPAQGGALKFINGETWHVQVGNVEKGMLAINSGVFGQRQVPLSQIASIEFQAADSSAPREPGHLYRSNGEPIPGKLIWVRQKDIAIDCPLGVIPVPRQVVQRFVLAKPRPPAQQSTDEVRLMDGSHLHGTATLQGAQLVLQHPVLGEAKFDWNAVHHLRRNPAGFRWLDRVPMTVVEQIGPALPPPAPQVREARDDTHLRAIRIMPHTVVRFGDKSDLNRAGHFRALLAVIPGSRSAVKVSISSGGSVLWEKKVESGQEPIPLSLVVSSAGEVTVTVDFDGPLAFPCGIELRDAHVQLVGNPPSEPQPNNNSQN